MKTKPYLVISCCCCFFLNVVNSLPHKSSPGMAQSSHHTPGPGHRTCTWPLEEWRTQLIQSNYSTELTPHTLTSEIIRQNSHCRDSGCALLTG